MRAFLPFIVLLIALTVGCAQKHYTGTVVLKIAEPQESSVNSDEIQVNHMMSADALKLGIHLAVIESAEITKIVASKLIESGNHKRFLEPYEKDQATLETLLNRYREVTSNEIQRTITINYSHPDLELALSVADSFANAFLDYTERLNIDGSRRAIKDLNLRVEQTKKHVEKLNRELKAFCRLHEINKEDLDSRDNRLRNELKSLSQESDSTSITRKEAELEKTSDIKVQYDSLLREIHVQEHFCSALNDRIAREQKNVDGSISKRAFILKPAHIN